MRGDKNVEGNGVFVGWGGVGGVNSIAKSTFDQVGFSIGNSIMK